MSDAQIIPNEYTVRLEFFTGPMDLLLHLVEQHEVEIEKVDLRDICNQYLEIVNHLAELDLDRASEYLVVAATLAARKSEALLPNNSGTMEGLSSEEQFDPRFFSELRERLIVYKEAKLRAEKLIEAPQLGLNVFSPRRQIIQENDDFEEIQGDGLALGRLFYGLLKKIGEAGKSFRVRLEPITVVKYMVSLVDRLSQLKDQAASFLSLAGDMDDRTSPRARLTGTFVATLELIKRGVVTVENGEGNFVLNYRSGTDAVLASEFDESDKIIELSDYRQPEGNQSEEQTPKERKFREAV